MTELLPCPFCGGEAETLTAESMHGGYLFGIMCSDCRSRGDVYNTEAEAIAAWNTRAVVDITSLLNADKPPITYVQERTCRNISGENWWAFECSECGEMIEQGVPEYCPSCGAKVVGE